MTTLYEYYNAGDTETYAPYGVNWVAQTFTTAGGHHSVTSVKLKLYRIGSPGTITVSIRATDGSGHPTGADLTSGTTNGNTLPTGSPYEWREITMTEYTLDLTTKYAIVLRDPDGDASNRPAWRMDATNPTYDGGNREASSNSGATWTADVTDDMMFEVWGNPVPTNYYQTISEILGMSDSVGSKAAFKQTISDILGMLDSAIRRGDFKQAITDSLGLSDLIGTKVAFKQAVSEVLAMLDSAARSQGFHVSISEILGLRDYLEAKKHVGRLGDLPDHYREGGA